MSSVHTEKKAMLVIRLLRLPNRSVSGPIVTAPMPTPTSPMVATRVSVSESKPSALVLASSGITAPSTTRSKPSRATAAQHRMTGHMPRDAGAAA